MPTIEMIELMSVFLAAAIWFSSSAFESLIIFEMIVGIPITATIAITIGKSAVLKIERIGSMIASMSIDVAISVV